ncbi:MAG TPA: chemotaxis protein CheB [Candidatus Eisenbacteria bacterium]|nr:chemotaxis protein CheB [Candidatus Eisenbacteria bacterium]
MPAQPPPDVAGRVHTGAEWTEESRAAGDVVAIAASAGGLPAISAVLAALPPDLEAAVLVVQHIDPRHRSLLAEILGRRCALPVAEARDGERLRPGQVRVAPPDRHLLVNQDGTLSLSQTRLVHFVRPSADLLFESAALAYRERVIAVVLTGTGIDGRRGAAAVRQLGGTVIAQDEATSEFFGMPGAVIRSGAVDLVLPLHRIGPAITGLLAGEPA